MRTIGTATPIYFPNIQSPFNGITHKQAACSCFPDQFDQKFHCTDTLTISLWVENSINIPRLYVVNELGQRISPFIGGTNITGSFNYWYFNISLNDYCDSKIAIEYTEFTIINPIPSVSYDISEYFYVTSDFDCVDCARKIVYSGDCFEFDTNYGQLNGEPEFEFTLRLDGSLDVTAPEIEEEFYKNSMGVYGSCAVDVEEIWRFNISYIPSWMRRKLFYIFRSRNLSIDGTEFIPNSTLNQGQTSGFLSEADILLKPKNAFATVTGCC